MRSMADSPHVREAIERLLASHDPYPAFVIDRQWDVVARNASTAVLIKDVAPELLVPPVNALRLALHPSGLAPQIDLRLLNMVATFGTALDVTAAELVIEAFYPADPATAQALEGIQQMISSAQDRGRAYIPAPLAQNSISICPAARSDPQRRDPSCRSAARATRPLIGMCGKSASRPTQSSLKPCADPGRDTSARRADFSRCWYEVRYETRDAFGSCTCQCPRRHGAVERIVKRSPRLDRWRVVPSLVSPPGRPLCRQPDIPSLAPLRCSYR